MTGIFISYRREDSAGWAGRLFHALKDNFGVEQVFMDIEALEPGVDFAETIRGRIASSEVLLAIIGPRWLDTSDREGRRRLDDPEDFIRLELTTALEGGMPVIPVLVGGAAMPAFRDLPENLRSLAARHAHEFSDRRWEFDQAELIKHLEKLGCRSAGGSAWPNADPIYYEAFKPDSQSGSEEEEKYRKTWPVGWGDGWTREMARGEYIWTNTDDDTSVDFQFIEVSIENPQGLESVDLSNKPVTVDVKIEFGGHGAVSGAGLMYRYKADPKSYYALTVGSEGRFALYKRSPEGKFSTLHSTWIEKIDARTYNRLGIQGMNDEISIFLNGKLIRKIKDDTCRNGVTGLIALGICRYYFDNFTVYG